MDVINVLKTLPEVMMLQLCRPCGEQHLPAHRAVAQGMDGCPGGFLAFYSIFLFTYFFKWMVRILRAV